MSILGESDVQHVYRESDWNISLHLNKSSASFVRNPFFFEQIYSYCGERRPPQYCKKGGR